ncbi:MAG: hypothetical protein JNL75_03755 [Chitinophagales bacterium]|nr:hypothetical protein [Chitinophagales bacterium]
MKKIFLILATIVLANSAYSQAAAGLRGGLTLADGATYFGPGASFQYGINENIVIGLNFDYQFGSGGASLMNIEPRFDYYFNSAFNGFHAGTNISYLRSSVTIPAISFGGVVLFPEQTVSAGQMAIGGLAGYTHPLSDAMFVDVSCGGAYMLDGKAFAVRPTLTFGYKFGGK